MDDIEANGDSDTKKPEPQIESVLPAEATDTVILDAKIDEVIEEVDENNQEILELQTWMTTMQEKMEVMAITVDKILEYVTPAPKSQNVAEGDIQKNASATNATPAEPQKEIPPQAASDKAQAKNQAQKARRWM